MARDGLPGHREVLEVRLGLPQPGLQIAALCAEVVGLGPGGVLLEVQRVEQGLDVHAVTACGSRQVGAFAPVRRRMLLGDRGYDHDKYRRRVWDLGVKPLIARRGTEHGSGLGTQRRFVEPTFGHLHWFRRLRIRWEIRDGIHEAFLTLACALICWRRLKPSQ
ncbi:hypothetical protein [Streptomyces sp. NPDC054765]